MTVSTTTVIKSYSGNASTTAFPTTFVFGATTEVSWSVSDAADADVSGSYTGTVTGGADADGIPGTGTVTLSPAPASGTTVLLVRITPKTNDTTWAKNAAFPEKAVERAFDRSALRDQELGEVVDRALVIDRLTDTYDADGVRIRNVPDATEQDEPATYGQLLDALAAPSYTPLISARALDITQMGVSDSGASDQATAFNAAIATAAADDKILYVPDADYRFDSPMLLVSDLRMHLAPRAKIIGTFATTGMQALVCQAGMDDPDTIVSGDKISNIRLYGGIFTKPSNGSDDYAGNIFALYADDFEHRFPVVDLYGSPTLGGRAWLLVGDDIVLIQPRAWRPNTAVRNGGIRFAGGARFKCHGGEIISGDDAIQFTPIDPKAGSHTDVSVSDSDYYNVRVKSYAGRAMVALTGNASTDVNVLDPFTAAITDCGFHGIKGSAGGTDVVRVMNTDSEGAIDGLKMRGCDISGTGSAKFVAWRCSGGLTNVDIDCCTFPSMEISGYYNYTDDAHPTPSNATLDGRTESLRTRTFKIRGGSVGPIAVDGVKELRATDVTFTGDGTNTVVRLGSGTSAEKRVLNAMFTDCTWTNIPDSLYGVSNQMTQNTRITGGKMICKTGATTAIAVRNATLSGNVGGLRTYVDGLDISEMGNTTPFTGPRLNGSKVRNVSGYGATEIERTAASGASHTFSNIPDDIHQLQLNCLALSSDGTGDLLIEVSDDGGSTWYGISTGRYNGENAGVFASGARSDGTVLVAGALAATDTQNLTFDVFDIQTASKPKFIRCIANNSGTAMQIISAGRTATIGKINALRVSYSSGNIDAGTSILTGW